MRRRKASGLLLESHRLVDAKLTCGAGKVRVGSAHDDLSEGQTLLRLDEQWLTVTRGHVLLEAYERHGNVFRLAFVKDRAGNQVTLDYDAEGRLHRLIAPHVQVAFRHDTRGRIVGVTHHDAQGEYVGTLANYEYDDQNDLIGATDRYGNRREYRYRHHLVTRYTDRTGRGVNLEWNGDGDLSPLKYPTVKLVARPQEKPCHEEIAVQ
ncbi:hypothetical protein [Burkholderia sp. Tr-20390]|uniref:hypothetical protein n=1 Tax=Burkholderia sp. Tr-20390 TaxID=2703904 RepID=UPI003216F1F8